MLTAAYIGFGVSAREYHIPYVEKREDVKIKYVYRRREDIAQNAAYEPFYPEIIFTEDLEQVLQDAEVDPVVVCSPDAFHVPYAKQILQAGKHALIEKPFAPTAAEAREVFAPAPQERWGRLVYLDENGERTEEKVPVGCAHYERIYDSLVDAIENGAPKCVKDEEVVKVLEILEEATAVAKSHGKV